MIKPKKNPVTKLIGAGVKAAIKKTDRKITTSLERRVEAGFGKADKTKAKANARGLKAANKPTKASKTFIGSNKNLSPSVRRDIIVNQTKPARPNRERGGSLKTLRKQGKTSSTQSPLRNLKPMEDVPAKVSARSSETIARLMKEQTKKKSK